MLTIRLDEGGTGSPKNEIIHPNQSHAAIRRHRSSKIERVSPLYSFHT